MLSPGKDRTMPLFQGYKLAVNACQFYRGFQKCLIYFECDTKTEKWVKFVWRWKIISFCNSASLWTLAVHSLARTDGIKCLSNSSVDPTARAGPERTTGAGWLHVQRHCGEGRWSVIPSSPADLIVHISFHTLITFLHSADRMNGFFSMTFQSSICNRFTEDNRKTWDANIKKRIVHPPPNPITATPIATAAHPLFQFPLVFAFPPSATTTHRLHPPPTITAFFPFLFSIHNLWTDQRVLAVGVHNAHFSTAIDSYVHLWR